MRPTEPLGFVAGSFARGGSHGIFAGVGTRLPRFPCRRLQWSRYGQREQTWAKIHFTHQVSHFRRSPSAPLQHQVVEPLKKENRTARVPIGRGDAPPGVGNDTGRNASGTGSLLRGRW